MSYRIECVQHVPGFGSFVVMNDYYGRTAFGPATLKECEDFMQGSWGSSSETPQERETRIFAKAVESRKKLGLR